MKPMLKRKRLKSTVETEIYHAAVVEYMTAEVIEQSGYALRHRRRRDDNPRAFQTQLKEKTFYEV